MTRKGTKMRNRLLARIRGWDQLEQVDPVSPNIKRWRENKHNFRKPGSQKK